MPLVITTPNVFLFAFTEPVGIGPDPQTFSGTSGFTFTMQNPTDISVELDPTPYPPNMGNVDWFGNDPAFVAPQDPSEIVITNLTTSSGTVTVNIDADFDFYNRLGEGEVVTVRWDLNITETNTNQTDTALVRIVFTGRNDAPTAVNDTRTINDTLTSFDDGTVLADDFDIDIKDDIAISNAVLSGPVTASVPAVFPIEYVAKAAGAVDHDGDSVKFELDRYFKFLAAGEQATFQIQYTITDGLASSNAFLTVTINGTNTGTFVGTKKGEEMLGENDKDSMVGKKGNDSIRARDGKDSLFGDEGNDLLVGGLGGDSLTGGKNNDTFDIDSIAESTVAARDKILDFKHGDDTIDLSTIDATAGVGDTFIFIKKQAFHNVEGELRYEKSGSAIVITGDVNGDAIADFAIQVNNLSKITAGDFDL